MTARAERRRIVRVAVTGHRPNQVANERWPLIRAEVARIFDALEAAPVEGDAVTPGFVLHTALAEGADRLVAELAMQRAWRIDAFLPFSEPRYLQDFQTDQSKAEFNRLLWVARGVSRMEGERLEKEAGGAAPYAAVGQALIARADILICIWNGLPPKGPGGTSEVAALMLEKGGLVLWIPIETTEVRLVSPAPLPRAGSVRRKLHEALAAHFPRVVRPAEMRVA